MTQISTMSGLVGEEYGSFDDTFTVTAFRFGDEIRYGRVNFDSRDEAADYQMDLEYRHGIACHVVCAA